MVLNKDTNERIVKTDKDLMLFHDTEVGKVKLRLIIKASIPQNSSSEPSLQSFLKSQTSWTERHSPDVQLNFPSGQDDTMTNNTAKKCLLERDNKKRGDVRNNFEFLWFIVFNLCTTYQRYQITRRMLHNCSTSSKFFLHITCTTDNMQLLIMKFKSLKTLAPLLPPKIANMHLKYCSLY